MISELPEPQQLAVMSDLFCTFAYTYCHEQFPSDFLQLTLSASQHLNMHGRSNVVCGLAKTVGRMRPDGSDSRFPVKRVPMGVLKHMVQFFNADTYQKVRHNGAC